jgi:organic hydroperoxide reductase OsmC/OhrA
MKSSWIKDKIVTLSIDGKPELEVSTPVDFWPDAPLDMISPEDLFVASAVTCYGVSLSGVSQRFHAHLLDFNVTGVGTLQKGDNGWEFEKITLNAAIKVPTEKDKKRMVKAAERAHTFCLVANSMKCPVELNYTIEVVPTIIESTSV